MFPPPSLKAPELKNFQWQFGGLTFGANTPIGVLKVEGLDLAGIRNGDVNWPRDHGQQRGLDLYEGRDILFDVWMKSNGESLQATQLKLAAVMGVLPFEEAPLWFQLPGLPPLCVMCRPRKRKIPIDADYAAAQVAKPELIFHATDPRIYTAGNENTLKRKIPAAIKKECEVSTVSKIVKMGSTAGLAAGMRVVAGGVIAPGTVILKVIGAKEIEVSANPLKTETVELEFFGPGVATTTLTNTGNTELRQIVLFNGPLTNPFIRSKVEGSGDPTVTIINPLKREEREAVAAAALKLRVTTEETERFGRETGELKNREKWEEKLSKEEITKKEYEEKLAAQKVEREEAELDEKEAREKAEKEEKEAREKAEEEERIAWEKEEDLTVKEGEQILVDFGTPHIVQLLVSGKEPKNIAGWVTPNSTWWDLLAGANPIEFGSVDEKETAGSAVVQWASAYEL